MNKYIVSYFITKESKPDKDLHLIDILKDIKEGEWKESIDELRYNKSQGDEIRANEIKSSLPCFTISAIFNNRRKKANLSQYSNLISLDYDKVDNPEELRSSLSEIPFTFSAFVSPSGNGVKVIVKTNNKPEDHEKSFKAIREYYDTLLGVESDESVKDITRLCFVSYDPDLFLNEKSEVFKVLSPLKSPEWIWDFSSNKKEFKKDNRNNFVYFYGRNANRYGLKIQDTIDYALNYSQTDFDADEITKAIHSAYNENSEEHGIYGGGAKATISSTMPEVDIQYVSDSPFIGDEVYDCLPPILKNACTHFTGRERDVVLLSALAVLSGGFFNVQGLYRGDLVYPNIYTFIIANPASGKGRMKYARQLANCFDNFLREEKKLKMKKYKREMRLFKRKENKASMKELDNLIEPEKPSMPVFFISANSSAAHFFNQVRANGGIGCICDTEADTINNVLKQEWGDYTNNLNKNWHHEALNKGRVSDDENDDEETISNTRFSIAITGTPNQEAKLIDSVNNGLFSRFSFYFFEEFTPFDNPFDESLNKDYDSIFDEFSTLLCDKFRNETTQTFRLTTEQGLIFYETFKGIEDELMAFMPNNFAAVCKRYALMAFKIAMTLTAMRSDEAELVCSDEDFNIALALVKNIFIPNGLKIYKKVTAGTTKKTTYEVQFLDQVKVGDNFRRDDVKSVAKAFGRSDRLLSNDLHRFMQNGYIEKVKHGLYKRIK